MGASQSKADTHPRVFHPPQTPIEISEDVVHNLSKHLTSEDTAPERRLVVDSHIRDEIHRALEKENLDRELSMVKDVDSHGDVKNSVALIGDLEEIRSKVDRFQARRQLDNFPSVKENGEAVASCYKLNATTPLNCWREVANFRAAVADAETQYLASLR